MSSDLTYLPKTYKKDGGDTIVVGSGGAIQVESGGSIVLQPGATVSANVYSLEAAFVEDATSLTHTATFTIPAGATLNDIIVTPVVLWGATTSAGFTCGDVNSANGWFTTTDLKATDLVLGERLQAANATRWGGVNGAYLVSATGRFGQQSTNMIGGYSPNAYSVIGVITVVGPSATTGRTRMTVIYTMGTAVVPVLA